MALYEYAAYGEINPNNVLFGAAAGGASSLIGAVVANRFPSVADDTINLGKIDSPDADTVVKSTVKDEAVINLEGQDLEALKTVLPIVMKNKATIIDTLEYKMADANGELLGEGFTNVKENKLWYKGYNTPFIFHEEGTYTFKVKQAMRKFNQVNGVDKLDGVTEVGFRIENE